MILSLTALVFADGGAGSGESGEGENTGTANKEGLAFVWYDRGGWKQESQAGSKVAPVQGSYDTATGKWIKGSSGQYTMDFFIDKLNDKIDGFDNYRKFNSRHQALENAMIDACEKAVARNHSDTKTARVVGVAITYCGWNDGSRWGIAPYTGNKTFVNMFGNREPNTTSELAASAGWTEIVDRNKYNGANANETWVEYVYRMGKEDNASFASDKGEGIYRVFVVAVSDDQPPTQGKFKLKKTSSNTSITG